MNVFGYETKTTFWNDFSIADVWGAKAIRETYKRASEEWKSNTEYVTELVMVLNWKSWEWAEKDTTISQLYADLFYELQNWCFDNLKGEDLDYFICTTD